MSILNETNMLSNLSNVFIFFGLSLIGDVIVHAYFILKYWLLDFAIGL